MLVRRAERHAGRRGIAGAAAVLAAGAVVLVPAATASAAAGPHDPIGAVTATTAVTGGLRFIGWAADPDALTTNDTVAVIVDGTTQSVSAPTSLVNAAVTTAHHTGPTPGFSITTPIAAGAHTACLVAKTIGAGLDTVLKCVTTPLGTPLTAAQLAAHQPVGAISAASAASTSVRFTGWATDPDYVSRRSIVVLYVDGVSSATIATHYYPLPRPAGAGWPSAFDITVPVATGTHLGCIWVVNVGLGAGNTSLGCKAVDTRGVPLTGTAPTPHLNPLVLAEAKKHIGQSYVWGAAGPSTFDCSGLVMYSYGKVGYATPRTSEAQAVKANLIPASRAVPGDLVFTHDTEGDVYHVGIYVSPGKALAAIDEEEGVNYQTIWDPANTTYGSFTHR